MVGPVDLFSPGDFAARDMVLAYRDIQVGAALNQLAKVLSVVWGIDAPTVILDGYPGGQLGVQAPLPMPFSTPGSVQHVDSSSVPYDATTTDVDLYGRDSLLYAVIYLLAAYFSPNPIPPPAAFPTKLGDAWSAAGAFPGGLTVSAGRWMDVGLFRGPDSNLAWRDNLLASKIAAVELVMANPFLTAERLYLLASSGLQGLQAQPDQYNLISDDGEDRIWVAYPLISGGLSLTYRRSDGSVFWVGEAVGPSPGPVPAATAFVTPTGYSVQIVPAAPAPRAAYFCRQKSSRLTVRQWQDSVALSSANPSFQLVSNSGSVVYQQGQLLFAAVGSAVLAVPSVLQSGFNRFSFLVRPDTQFALPGFANSAGSADGTAVTLSSPGSVTWSLPLPLGPISVAFNFTDKTTQTPSFPVQLFLNGLLVFDGTWAFNLPPGTISQTQPIQFPFVGGNASLRMVWTHGLGSLTVQSLDFTSIAQAGVYSLSCTVGSSTSQQLTLQAVPGRSDVAQLDVLIGSPAVVPQVVLAWSGGAGMVLFVESYDVTTFQPQALIQDATQYDPSKRQLLDDALDAVRGAYASVLKAFPNSEFRTPSTGGIWVWDSAANSEWVASLDSAGAQITQAFRPAVASDMGRMALIPAGLSWGGEEEALAAYPAPQAQPVLRSLQPWMLYFGAYVAGPDFWPQQTPAGASFGTNQAQLPQADFVFAVVGAVVGEPTIVNLTALTQVNGIASDSPAFEAWTYANQGAAAGNATQTFIATVWLVGLTPGTVYFLTYGYTQIAQAGGSSTLSDQFQFTAISTSPQVQLPPFEATVGFLVQLDSVLLS